ncbi:OmpW family outer membrane protein [Xanthobacter autotrophicus]|uniref:OmpW/AlkL family protein n=2 Tax=Xanthobacter autotrophicus TaxID=280 RepID=UPI003728B2F7
MIGRHRHRVEAEGETMGKRYIATAALALFLSGQVHAADLGSAAPEASVFRPWYIHVGAMGVIFDEGASITLGGTPVPGVSATADDNFTVGFEVGYRFTPNIAVSFTAGFPPSTTLTGTGPLAGIDLGRVTYGPAVLSAHYHFTNFGPLFQPYLGAGVNYTLVWNEKDRAVRDLKVDNAFGFVLQAGIESDISEHWGSFVDVKKIFLTTDATGLVGGVPATADIDLNPWILMGGVTYRF